MRKCERPASFGLAGRPCCQTIPRFHSSCNRVAGMRTSWPGAREAVRCGERPFLIRNVAGGSSGPPELGREALEEGAPPVVQTPERPPPPLREGKAGQQGKRNR